MVKRTLKTTLKEKAKSEVNEKILNYFAENFNSVIYMTLDKLCYVTETTPEEMNAFFESLGYANMLEFKNGLREIVYNEFNGPDNISETSLRGIVDMVMRYEMLNMTEFVTSVDLNLIDRLAQDILSVPEVYIIGMRASTPLTIYAAHILSKVGVKTTKIDVVENFIDYIVNMDRAGLVLAFGFSRYHKGSIMLLNSLKKSGFNIVSITDYPMSPMANASKYCIYIPRHSHDYTVSYVAGTMMLNVLAIHIASQDKDGLLKRIRHYDETTQNLEYYF